MQFHYFNILREIIKEFQRLTKTSDHPFDLFVSWDENSCLNNDVCSTARYAMPPVPYLPRNRKNADQWGEPFKWLRISITGDPWTMRVWTAWVHLPAIFFSNKSSQPFLPPVWVLHLQIQPTADGKTIFAFWTAVSQAWSPRRWEKTVFPPDQLKVRMKAGCS